MNCIEFTCELKNIYTLLAQSFVCLKFAYLFIDNPTKYTKESDADIFFSNFWCVFNIYTVYCKYISKFCRIYFPFCFPKGRCMCQVYVSGVCSFFFLFSLFFKSFSSIVNAFRCHFHCCASVFPANRIDMTHSVMR